MLYRQEASPSKSQPKLFHLITIWMGPAFVSFFLHQFPAHLRSSSGRCILGGGQTIAYRSRLWGLFPVAFVRTRYSHNTEPPFRHGST